LFDVKDCAEGVSVGREYPKQPVPAVGAVILRGASVLLVQRDHEPGLGEWSLPGGVVEVGESLELAVRREILEETSLDIEVKGLVDVLNRIVHDPSGKVQYHYVLVDFWAIPASGHAQPRSDVRAVQWVPVNELDKWDVRSGLKEVVRKALEMRDREKG
jgi:ADP-ribose pyrophosphatase YjhB (NUDIX family)